MYQERVLALSANDSQDASKMARILCQTVGGGPTFLAGCRRVATWVATRGKAVLLRPSTVGFLTAEDEPGCSRENLGFEESEGPGSATMVSMSFAAVGL